MFKERLYKSGSGWALWRWAKSPLLYMTRLMLIHTPWGGVMLNFISQPDPWLDMHDHPANFWSFILNGWYTEKRGTSKNLYVSLYWWNMACEEPGRPLMQWWKDRFTVVSRINRMVASNAMAHTIYECHPDTMTLVFYGPRKREWGYHTPNGWVSWKEYKPV